MTRSACLAAASALALATVLSISIASAQEAPRAPVEQQKPAAEAKVEQQPAAPANSKEARAEAAPINSAPSVDRARVAVQPAQEQVPTGQAFTPRQPRNFGYGGYGYGRYGGHPTFNQQCEH